MKVSMIEARLEFDKDALCRVLGAFLKLPSLLKPTHYCDDEESEGESVGDGEAFLATMGGSRAGFLLKGSGNVYDISIAGDKPIICNCFLEVDYHFAQEFLIHMAGANPIFGFACTPEEKEAKNRVTTKQGVNTIESWVGRDTRKYIPGLYWLTLLSTSLAEKHNVSLSAIEGMALEHVELEGGQHLFRFYEAPEKWRCATEVAELYSSLPGVFNIEKVRPQIESAKNFLDLNAIIKNWK
jgi:hypothetical protein